MVQTVDCIVEKASALLTLSGAGPARGPALGQLGPIENGAMAIDGQTILAVGTTPEIRQSYDARQVIDAGGRAVVPGFIDPHTHLIFAGSRQNEFEQRLSGATYQQIMASGGGIMSTVRATRAASMDELVSAALPRLSRFLAHGTTTVEAKTGYGLTTNHELTSLAAIHHLSRCSPIELVPTFLGAHAVPEEFSGRTGQYVDLVVHEMLPVVTGSGRHSQTGSTPMPSYCDVFCDEGAFDLSQTERILRAARSLGLGLKVHADEFAHLGAAQLAADLRAVSAEHLLHTSSQEMSALAGAGVVGVLLPGTPFGLGLHEYGDARSMIAAGMIVALATDLNPGTCYCESMPFVMALACRFMHLTPAEALVASTVNAAFAIGRGSDLGRLWPGYQADAVILDESDYRSLAYRFGTNPVYSVIKKGKVVYQ